MANSFIKPNKQELNEIHVVLTEMVTEHDEILKSKCNSK